MTHPRIVVRGATYAVTRRCVCRKSFLGWWSDEVDAVWLWCLALAAEKCNVDIHHAVRVGSHYHLTFTIREENLGRFLWWLNRSLSCALNALLEKHGIEAPRELFDSRHTYVERLVDAESQLANIVYERLNPPAAGLAETCDDLPGMSLPPAMWKGAPRRLERPTVYFKKGPNTRLLQMSPPPLLYLAFGGDVDALVHHTSKLERVGERTLRIARGQRRVRTHAEVRSIDPWSEPASPRERSDGRHDGFKCATREDYHAGRREVRRWRSAYREARCHWQRGNREVFYPHGTYEMRRFHGANVAEPDDDARVSAPGPTIEEAQALVEQRAAERDWGIVERVKDTVAGHCEDWSKDDSAETPAAPWAGASQDDRSGGSTRSSERGPSRSRLASRRARPNWQRRSGGREIAATGTHDREAAEGPAAKQPAHAPDDTGSPRDGPQPSSR